MLNRRGAEPDVVKVLDFGLVKALRDGKRDRESSGELSGTPLYMSPETIRMPDSVDSRSDLYAIGAVGYFCSRAKRCSTPTLWASSASSILLPVPSCLRNGWVGQSRVNSNTRSWLAWRRPARQRAPNRRATWRPCWTASRPCGRSMTRKRGGAASSADSPLFRTIRLPSTTRRRKVARRAAPGAAGTVAPSFDRTLIYDPPGDSG